MQMFIQWGKILQLRGEVLGTDGIDNIALLFCSPLVDFSIHHTHLYVQHILL